LKNLPLALSFLLFTFAHAAKGPQYQSLKVHGMGGAFVAVADNKDALYYNPAGLNLINRLGNFQENPDMGYMPRSNFEVRSYSFTVFLPGKEIGTIIDACGAPTIGKIIKKVLVFDFGYFGDADWCPAYFDIVPDNDEDWSDSLDAHPELAENIRKLNRSSLDMGAQISLFEMAFHNFGFSGWVNGSYAPWVDVGIIVPIFGYEPVQIDGVVQTAFAFSPVDQWSVGAGLKVAKRYRQSAFTYKPGLNYDGTDVTLDTTGLHDFEERWENFGNYMLSTDGIAFGLDLGVLYQITREIRLGSSIRNIFFGKLGGESITPNLSIGGVASPMILQSNSLWGRKVNFAIDYVDILDGTITDKFTGHLNLGAEIDQVVIPTLTKELSSGYRTLYGFLGSVAGFGIGYLIGGATGQVIGMGLGGLVGFSDAVHVSLGCGLEGGYPAYTAGLGLMSDAVNIRFSSYAEERGLKTGQNGHRFWAVEASAGASF